MRNSLARFREDRRDVRRSIDPEYFWRPFTGAQEVMVRILRDIARVR